MAALSLRKQLNISRFAIRYAWLTMGFWLAVVVAGCLAFSSLKYALFPDITFPVVVVSASTPTETALETETQLTNPIEQQLADLPDNVSTRSSTYPGRSVVSLEFPIGSDLGEANQTVETALASLTLPTGSKFQVIPFNLNESTAVSYALQSNTLDLQQLDRIALEKIAPAFVEVPGVLKVNLVGEPAAEASENSANRSGKITSAAASGLADFSTLVRFDSQSALALEVVKQADANTLEVVERVEQVAEELRQELPTVQLAVAATQADYIRETTQATIDALFMAIILAIAIVFPFLGNLRATLITALAIPISLLGTFIVMAWFGFNLETITLLALALVIGIIVDDAIVDVENITRHIDQGESPREAAIASTNEIGVTVSASSLTIVAVFLPVAFMGGIIGQFFKPFGLTIATAVLVSLLVARTLSPVLAVRWLKPIAKPAESADSTSQSTPSSKAWDSFAHQYRRVLRWSLRHRVIVLLMALLSLAVGIGLIPLIPQGFIPQLDRGELNIAYTLSPDRNAQEELADSIQERLSGTIPAAVLPQEILDDASPDGSIPSNPVARDRLFPGGVPRDPDVLKQLLYNEIPLPVDDPDALRAMFEDQIPTEIKELSAAKTPGAQLTAYSRFVTRELEENTFLRPEVESILTIIGDRGQPNKGKLYVKLSDARQAHTAEIRDLLRYRLPALPGVSLSIEEVQFVDTGGEKPLQVAFLSDDLDVLSDTVQTIESRVRGYSALADVSATGQRDDDGEILQIEHRRGQRAAYIRANISEGYTLGEATDLVVDEAKLVMPEGVKLNLGGDSARIGEILSSFGSTMVLAVFCILGILLLLFRSWLDPLVILLSLPLSIVGAMLALLLSQSDFGIISLLGLIFLLGIINKNAILLVDYINQLRLEGMSRAEAILEAGPVRLRPILMTTSSTILGMMPIAVGFGAGAELRSPMAVAIIGGLITSSLLSLIVVPVLYSLLDGLRSQKRFQQALRAKQ